MMEPKKGGCHAPKPFNTELGDVDEIVDGRVLHAAHAIKALPCLAAATTMLSIGGCFMQPKPISGSLIRLGGR
jgi:hypothetical protein